MTPKQKAQELYKIFLDIGLGHDWAKQCALVAVDEIMYNCYQVMKPFWQEVKQEIEKL